MVHVLALWRARLHRVGEPQCLGVAGDARLRNVFKRASLRMSRSLRFFLIAFVSSLISAGVVFAGTVQPIADLAVTKTGPAQAAPGSDVTYTIHVTNGGPDPSTTATLVDGVPQDMSFVSLVAPAGWSCMDPTQTSNNRIVCTSQSVPLGADDVFSFVFHISPEAAPGAALTNVVRVSTPPYNDPTLGEIPSDPNEENNTAFATTTIPGGSGADLSVTKKGNPTQALPDSDVTYTITVANAGPAPAQDVTLTDTLPQAPRDNAPSIAMTFVSFSQPAGWSCITPTPGSTGTITCTTSSQAASSSSTFTLVAHVPANAVAGDQFTNVASASTSTEDPNPENNSGADTTSVVTFAPTLSTQASASVILGASISDTATIAGGSNPTGSIAFMAYGPNDATCGGNPAFVSSVPVNGDGQYSSGPFVPSAPGTYRFVATYGGDFQNQGSTTPCNDPNESVVVIAPTPTPTPTPTPSPTPTPTPTATPAASPTPSATPSPSATPAQALNISTRLRVEAGDRALIGGFIIRGNAAKPVVLRGLGPSLMVSGLPGMMLLADPILELHGPNGALITSNDNWKDSPQRSQIEGTVFQPTNDKESVIVATLAPGNYTGVLRGVGETTGIGLVEIYDNSQAVDSDLANISTRGFVRVGNEVMIGGFTLGGNPPPTRIAVRALGPSLASSNIAPVLADPTLELHDANGAIINANDDWGSDPVSAAQLTANGLALPNPKESGIFLSLTPGQYTAIVAGKDGTIGIGLVEIYNVR